MKKNEFKIVIIGPGGVGKTNIIDRFTTNCLAYDTTEFADDDAFKEALEDITTAPGQPGSSLMTSSVSRCQISVTPETGTAERHRSDTGSIRHHQTIPLSCGPGMSAMSMNTELLTI